MGIFDSLLKKIVGAGNAGCVLGSRLSENGKHTVLLLEAGQEPHPGLSVPAIVTNYTKTADYVRRYMSVPQRNANLESNGILAGHSPYDYDGWANITNDDSWKYSNMLEYLKKSENYQGNFPSDQHGYDGPIPVANHGMLQDWRIG
ncbi:Oxygen-dependent choline dehydrogenase [Orchesella cincta]|uniref:Oxygen-dependent choline dehydrogenase n=1 Tax=Orchesella cincta TaxID=48709 RepID=A0A1D2MIK6_ORCCI|nr:Oxygen-dependent choline dehydrogenase [Orchesella cincta]